MGFIRPSALLFALLITTPAIYRYAVNELDVTSLLTRFVIAVVVAAVLLAVLRAATAGYGRTADPAGAVPVVPEPMAKGAANQSS